MKKSILSRSDFGPFMASFDQVLDLSRSLRNFLSCAKGKQGVELFVRLSKDFGDDHRTVRRMLFGLLGPVQQVAFLVADLHRFAFPLRAMGTMSNVTEETLLDSLRSFLTESETLLRYLRGLDLKVRSANFQERLIRALDTARSDVRAFLGSCSASCSSGREDSGNVQRSQRDDGTSVTGCSSGGSAGSSQGKGLLIQLSLSEVGDINGIVVGKDTSSLREARVSEAITPVLHGAGGNVKSMPLLSGDGKASAGEKVSPRSEQRSRDRGLVSRSSSGSSRGRGLVSRSSSGSSRDRDVVSRSSSGSSRDRDVVSRSSGRSRWRYQDYGQPRLFRQGSSFNGVFPFAGSFLHPFPPYHPVNFHCAAPLQDDNSFRSPLYFYHGAPFQPHWRSLPNVFRPPSTVLASVASSASSLDNLQPGGGSTSSVPPTPPSKLESVEASHEANDIAR